jgi:tetratricopeptide (TPR) repeat protein
MFRILALCAVVLVAAACTSHQEQVEADISSGTLAGDELARSHLERGYGRMGRNDLVGARADFDAAIAAAPTLAVAYALRAQTSLMERDVAGAFADYDRAIELSARDDPSGYVLRGNAFLAEKNYQRAIEDYDHALELDRSFWMARAGRGIALVEIDELDRALPDLDVAVVSRHHRIFFFATKESAAIAVPKGPGRGIRITGYQFSPHPPIAAAQTARGKLRLKRGAYEKAIEDFDAAIDRIAQLPEPHIQRGLARFALGQCDHGIADIRSGVSLRRMSYEATIEEHRAFIETTPCTAQVS